MLTTVWRSTTTQCLHSFNFTLVNKDIHSSLHCPAAVHCVGHHLCVAGDGSWTPCRQGCIQLLIYSYTKKYSFSKAGMVSFFMHCRYSFCAGQLSCDQKTVKQLQGLKILYGEWLTLPAGMLHAWNHYTLLMLFQVLGLWLHLKETLCRCNYN